MPANCDNLITINYPKHTFLILGTRSVGQQIAPKHIINIDTVIQNNAHCTDFYTPKAGTPKEDETKIDFFLYAVKRTSHIFKPITTNTLFILIQ